MTILLVLVILYAIFIGFYGVNKLNKFLTEVEPRSDYYQKPQLDENAADNEALNKKNDISFSRNSDHFSIGI